MLYGRFAAMMIPSTLAMFGLMYLSTYALDHVSYSQTRSWMALLMGAAMAVIMMGFVSTMYKNKALNAAIIGACVVIFAGFLRLSCEARKRSTMSAI